MGSPIKQRYLDEPKVIPDITRVLEANGQHYCAFRVRSVAFQEGGIWRNALTVAVAYPRESVPERQQSLRYEKVHLLEGWIDQEDLLPFVQSVRSGTMDVDGQAVLSEVSNPFGNVSQFPSNNEHSRYPGHRYICMSREVRNLPQEALLSYHLPFYSGPFEAMRDWCGMTSVRPENTGHVGSVYLFLPECRARFTNFTRVDGKLTMKVIGDAIGLTDLLIKGAWGAGSEYSSFEEPVCADGAEVCLPSQAEELEAYLIGPDETLYDWHHERRAWVFGQPPILGPTQRGGASEEIVLKALQQGEGPTTEFKPYLTVGDPKQAELVETVISFSNTSGGDILLGVNDHCCVEGIERAISRDAKHHQQTEDETIEIYTGKLRQMIAGAMNRSVALDFVPVQLGNHTVLLVKVPEGLQKPYFRIADKATFVRRGASNVPADPDQDFPRLIERPGFPW